MPVKPRPVPAGELPERIELTLLATADSPANKLATRQVWGNHDWGVTVIVDQNGPGQPQLKTFMMKVMPGFQYQSYNRMRYAYSKHVLSKQATK